MRPSANTVDVGVLLRIGHLIPAATGDYWWSLTAENARDIVDDALQAVVAYGLPWLRREVNVKANVDEPPIR